MQHVARCRDSQMFNSSAGVCRRSMAGPISIARSSPAISRSATGVSRRRWSMAATGRRSAAIRQQFIPTRQTGEDEVVFGRVVSLPDGLARAELAVLFRYDVVRRARSSSERRVNCSIFISSVIRYHTLRHRHLPRAGRAEDPHSEAIVTSLALCSRQSGAPIIDASFRNTCTDEQRLATCPGLPLASCKSGHIWSIPGAQRLVLAGGRLGLLDKARTSPGEDYSQASRKRRHPEASMLLAEETRY
jgi:hypothetical protein